MVIYRCELDDDPKQTVLSIAAQLGLQLDANLCADEDRVSAIENSATQQSHYIPYTNKALNWHTDGYYNAEHQRIHAFLIHCVRPAKTLEAKILSWIQKLHTFCYAMRTRITFQH